MNKYLLPLLTVFALSACSGPEDVLETAVDISVPDQLSGCVIRDDEDGSCVRAVCVADDESDCEEWIEACEEHDHVVATRNGHPTCERREEDATAQ